MKLKNTLLATLFLGGSWIQASAQDLIYDWGHSFGGSGFDIGLGITSDSLGNVILLSQFGGSYDADPGTGTTTLTSQGQIDASIAKYDPSGNLIWAESFGGTGFDLPYSVDTDSDGNIYIAGSFQNTVDFDPGTGTQNVTSNGAEDIFLLKLDENGAFQWVYTAGSTAADFGRGVAVDSANNVYFTGEFSSSLDFDPGAGTTTLTSEGGADIFVVQLNENGDLLNSYQAGGTLADNASDIKLDRYGKIYVSGYHEGTCNFDLSGSQNSTSAGDLDAFILKLDESLGFDWFKRIGGTGQDRFLNVEVDRKDNLILGGSFAGTVDFDPGTGTDNKTSVAGLDLMIIKLDNNGNYVFGVARGGSNSDFVDHVSVDQDNNIFAAGVIRYTVDFDPVGGPQNVTVTGGGVYADQFFWKMDEDGNYLFAENLGGTNNDHSFAVHPVGQFIYTTGYYAGTADFDLTAGTDNKTFVGGSDISFQKHVNCSPINTSDVIVSCGPITWIDGNTYTSNNNTATMMLTNQNGCDSLVTLDLTIINIQDQSVTASATEFCDDGTPTFETGSSENGVFYSLVDQSNGNVIDGPTEGTGAALTLNGGNITTTTTFEVQAETNKNHKLSFAGNSATPTYVSMGNEINDKFAGKNQITVEAWVNTNSANNLQSVVGNYGNFGNTMQFLLRLDNDSGDKKAAFWVGTGPNASNYVQVAGTTTISLNTWYHIAGTYDGNELSIYVNGVLENTVSLSATMPYVETEMKIGGGLSNNTEYFYGDITGVRIWDIARSESEINADKDQCIAGNTPGLVAMYNMINGEGSTMLTDESVNGFNGTLMNMDANADWGYTDLPAIDCQLCTSTLTQAPTVTVNYSDAETDVQEHCDTYTWIDGNTYTSSNNTATITLTNQVGCDSLVTLDLTINTTPTAGAVDNGDGTLSATGTGTYQWIDCATNTAITGETSVDFTPTQIGDYKVAVSNGNCADTSDCVTISTTVGLNEIDFSSLAVFPNPTKGEVQINVGSSIGNYTYSLISIDGKVILNGRNQTNDIIRLNLTDNASGIYLFTIQNESGSKTIRIVKN